MFLSKLTINVMSRAFRRDYADVQDMHRTLMSGYPDIPDGVPARQAHGMLWRLDNGTRDYTLYVQSRTRPDWDQLPDGYLAEPAQVRDLQPVLDAVTPGRAFSFRLVANPTRAIHPKHLPGHPSRGKRAAHRDPEGQTAWLANQAVRHGFVIPLAAHGQPDLAPTPCPVLRGNKGGRGPITIEPVRYDGTLIVTEPQSFREALLAGIGRAKAYGCGLLSLAPRMPTG